MRSYMHRTGAPDDIGPMVAVKDRQNALKNPYAHLKIAGHLAREGEGVADDVGPGALPRVVPVVRRRVRGGVHRRGGRQRGGGRRPPAGVDPRLRGALRAVAVPGSRPGPPAGRASTARPTCTARPASPTRSSRSTAPSSTCRSAGTSRCGSRATTSPPPARAGRWSSGGDTALDGSFPVNMSGGVLSSNPIGASGLLRFAEAALQVRGMAGEHQVDGAKVALGPGLRRRRPVLRHVGRRQLASTRSPPDATEASPFPQRRVPIGTMMVTSEFTGEAGMTITSIADIIRTHGRERPDAPALEFEDRTITFGELDARSNQARARRSRPPGSVRGDRVAFIDKNGPEWFEVTFAAGEARRGQRVGQLAAGAGRDGADHRRRAGVGA